MKLSRQTGLSLIELLIAMVLGLTLSAGVIQIYVGANTTERSQDARLRMQENGRFGLSFLSQEVRMAGYLGCLGAIRGVTVNNIVNDGAITSFQPQFGVQGWEAVGTDPGVVNNSANNVATAASTTSEWTTTGGNIVPAVNAVPNSDIVRVWSAAGNSGRVTSITAANVLTVETAAGLSVGDFVLLSDCEQADYAQVCSAALDAPATTSTIELDDSCAPGNNTGATLSSIASVAEPAEIIRLEGTLFYVGKRGDTATNSPSLYQAQLSTAGVAGTAEELVEGVESMQILYGVNIDQDVRSTVDTYLTADNVPDWNDVVSVRITLLMQSVEDGTVPEPQEYTFDGVTYGPNGGGDLPADNRVRRVFSTTIGLRNRALGV